MPPRRFATQTWEKKKQPSSSAEEIGSHGIWEGAQHRTSPDPVFSTWKASRSTNPPHRTAPQQPAGNPHRTAAQLGSDSERPKRVWLKPYPSHLQQQVQRLTQASVGQLGSLPGSEHESRNPQASTRDRDMIPVSRIQVEAAASTHCNSIGQSDLGRVRSTWSPGLWRTTDTGRSLVPFVGLLVP